MSEYASIGYWRSVELPVICELLASIDEERFSTPKLAGIASRLRHAGASLRSLRRLVTLLEQRNRRQGFLPVSYWLLWGTQFAMAIERWRWREGRQMLQWLETLGEFEALVCLATYSFEHPSDPFPEILAAPPGVDAQGLGHPLLDEASVVRNDVVLSDEAQFLVVSGSNMSGKSTFLRALGLNAVLAYMGATVRCRRLRLSIMGIAAATHVEDDVEGKSRFYSEMLRLKETIERASCGPLLFLIDEIMSGTNSQTWLLLLSRLSIRRSYRKLLWPTDRHCDRLISARSQDLMRGGPSRRLLSDAKL